MNSRRVWTDAVHLKMTQQDRAISQLIRQQGTKNWGSIATQLSKHLGEQPRSGKQCRQRWHNHLKPTIEKRDWSSEEELRLFQLHKCHGNKWTVIAEHLPGRTDNSIKNYFYSTIRRSLRRMGKFVGSKNSTDQMKKIKPSTLSKIFAAGSQLSILQGTKEEQVQVINYIKQNCESIRDEIIQFTNYKPKVGHKANHSERDRFQKVIAKMVHINQVYQKIKGEDKKRRNQQEMFRKEYSQLMRSSESQGISEEEESHQDRGVKKTPLSLTKPIKEEYSKEMQATNGKTDSANQLMPTVIIKSQPNSNSQDPEEEQQFENPDFLIEIKEELIPTLQHFDPTLMSPGFCFNTPSNNPFSFFQSPSMDSCFNSIQVFGGLHNNAIDQFQISIQKQIENNLSGQQKKLASSISTIGSPGSAFRYYGGSFH